MASEILGLFTSPQDYQMRQQQSAQDEALQFARLTPMQKASYGAYQGGRGLADFGGRLLGGEDPQLRMISQRQMLSREIDPGDPESILRAAQRAGQMGDQQFALTLSDYARKAQSEMALAGQRNAQANKEYKQSIPNDLAITQERAKYSAALRELKALPPSEENIAKINYLNDVLAGLPLPGAAKPIDKLEINKQLNTLRKAFRELPEGPSPQKEDLQAEIDFLSGVKEGKANIQEIGTAKGSDKPVYLDVNNDRQFIYVKDANGKQVRQDYTDGVDRTTTRVSATANSAGGKEQTAFQVGMAGAQIKQYENAIAKRNDAEASNTVLSELDRLSKKGVVGGSYASGRVGALNLLNTLGLVSPNDNAELSRSEQFQKQAKDLVLKSLGGKLGAGISNFDLDFVNRIVPQLENSPQARQELIDYMIRKNNEVLKASNELIDFAETNNTLRNFKPSTTARFFDPVTNAPKTGVAAMTTEEIKAEIARKKAQGK